MSLEEELVFSCSEKRKELSLKMRGKKSEIKYKTNMLKRRILKANNETMKALCEAFVESCGKYFNWIFNYRIFIQVIIF